MSTDLAAALETGVVVDTGTVGEFNDIKDPDGVWIRVNDAFQAMDAQKALRSLGMKSSAVSGSAAVSSAESTPSGGESK